MPEIWIPYGGVETLVTIQAENLGVVAEPTAEPVNVEADRVAELVRGTKQLFVCDGAPATMEYLKLALAAIGENQPLKIHSSAPKRVEMGIADLKGRVTTLGPPLASEEEGTVYAPQLLEPGPKLFIGSARPDPMFGLVDAKVEASLNWIARSRSESAGRREEMEPEPLRKTAAYESIEEIAGRMTDAKFITVVPRGGRVRSAMEDPPFDAIKNAFPKIQVAQSKGMVLGAGGRGYDDDLSSVLRGVWSAIDGVRKMGTLLIIAECSEGMGSTALEMLVTGRLEQGERRRKYVEGLEEVFYLNKLKEEYDVLLLSGLPETYARSKLGFTTAKGSGEAVGRVLNKVGRTGKLNVVPRAPDCLVQSG